MHMSEINHSLLDFSALYQVERHDETLLCITTPYMTPDNDYIDLYVKQENGLWLTDMGEIGAFLSLSRGIDIGEPAYRQCIERMLQGSGVELCNLELRSHLDITHGLASEIVRFTQAIFQVVSLAYR